MPTLDQFRIVLVGPLYGGNVGAVCRAMGNMGLRDLRLVTPHPSLDWEEAKKMATHSVDMLSSYTEAATLEEAVSDCGLVAGTTARAGLYRDHAKTPREWMPFLWQKSTDSKIALVFGREDKGLTNDELALCTQMIRIPSSDDHTSLNLAQAVMVCCYELYLASEEFEAYEEKSPEAPAALRERMFETWREALLDIGFMYDDTADHMMMGLRRILSRGQLTERDVKILMGMAKQTLWCAGEMKKGRDSVNSEQ